MARILITREHAAPLSALMVDAGLRPVHIPLIRREATAAAVPDLAPDAVLVTSAAVTRFVPDLKRQIGDARVVAVGAATAQALIAARIQPSGVGQAGGIEALDRLAVGPGEVIWYIGAEQPSARLAMALESAKVHRWSVYRTVYRTHNATSLRAADVSVVTFCSGSAVRAYVAAVGVPRCPVVVLGDSTAREADACGIRVAAVAAAPTLASLVDAVVALT